MVATGAPSLFFGPREPSDLWADRLGRWWGQVKSGLGHVRRLVVYLHNGPNGSGSRTQFLKRMVAFADASELVVRLVYYPRTTASTTRSGGAGRPWSGSGGAGC